MATKIYLQNPSTKDIKKVKIGIYWIAPFSHGVGVLFSWMIWPFGTYKRILRRLITRGYKLKSVEGGVPHELVEGKLGFSIPKYEDVTSSESSD